MLPPRFLEAAFHSLPSRGRDTQNLSRWRCSKLELECHRLHPEPTTPLPQSLGSIHWTSAKKHGETLKHHLGGQFWSNAKHLLSFLKQIHVWLHDGSKYINHRSFEQENYSTMMPFRDLRDCPHCPALYNGFSSSTKPTRAPGVIGQCEYQAWLKW